MDLKFKFPDTEDKSFLHFLNGMNFPVFSYLIKTQKHLGKSLSDGLRNGINCFILCFFIHYNFCANDFTPKKSTTDFEIPLATFLNS